MAKEYNLKLKGFVGGWDFDADYVDYVLEKNKDKEVSVLIDSLGGRTDTALSIYAAFKMHGNVNVHFVGMNASAATIASLGAKHITIDRSAMYLVHKCSISFFKWSQMNADDLQTLMEKIEKDKANLDKIDANVAEMYAAKCKKDSKALLDLMKVGGWLTSEEALEWGFVDEITDFEADEAPVIDAATAHFMSQAGIPVPPPAKKKTALSKFITSVADLFRMEEDEDENQNTEKVMAKTFKNICALLTIEALVSSEGKYSLTEEQTEAIEAAMQEDKNKIDSLKKQIEALENEKKTLNSKIETLEKKPAEKTKQVVESKKDENAVQDYVDTVNSAVSLYRMFD